MISLMPENVQQNKISNIGECPTAIKTFLYSVLMIWRKNFITLSTKTELEITLIYIMSLIRF